MGLNPAGVLRWHAQLTCVLGPYIAPPPRPDSRLRRILRSCSTGVVLSLSRPGQPTDAGWARLRDPHRRIDCNSRYERYVPIVHTGQSTQSPGYTTILQRARLIRILVKSLQEGSSSWKAMTTSLAIMGFRRSMNCQHRYNRSPSTGYSYSTRGLVRFSQY